MHAVTNGLEVAPVLSLRRDTLQKFIEEWINPSGITTPLIGLGRDYHCEQK